MTQSERFKFYKRTLFIYKLCRTLPFLKRYFRTYNGFCLYMSFHNRGLEWKDDKWLRMIDLTELIDLKNELKIEENACGYWFPMGSLAPRINFLETLIKKLETK